jgi:Iap family predicted aminopeptidase
MSEPTPTPEQVVDEQVHEVAQEVTTDAAPLLTGADAEVVEVDKNVVAKIHADLKNAATWFTGNRQRYFEELVALLEPHVKETESVNSSTPAPTDSTVQTG